MSKTNCREIADEILEGQVKSGMLKAGSRRLGTRYLQGIKEVRSQVHIAKTISEVGYQP